MLLLRPNDLHAVILINFQIAGNTSECMRKLDDKFDLRHDGLRDQITDYKEIANPQSLFDLR